jgi:hypothetical protein
MFAVSIVSVLIVGLAISRPSSRESKELGTGGNFETFKIGGKRGVLLA